MEKTRISEAELEVMQALWRAEGPLTAAQVRAALQNGWERTTVATLLSRLREKGAVTATPAGRGQVYAAAISREEYGAGQGKSLLRTLYGGSVKNFVAAMYDGGAVDAQELEALRALIDGWEEAKHDD